MIYGDPQTALYLSLGSPEADPEGSELKQFNWEVISEVLESVERGIEGQEAKLDV